MKTVLIIAALFFAACASLNAQTLNDPFPLIGNQAQAIAGTAAINSYLGPNGASRTCAKRIQWERHMDQRSVCRKSALKYPAGKERKSIRNYCDARYPALEYPGCG